MPPKVNDDRLGIGRLGSARRWLSAHPDTTVRAAWAALSAGAASLCWLLTGPAPAVVKLWSIAVMAGIAIAVSASALVRADHLVRQAEWERRCAEAALAAVASARTAAAPPEYRPGQQRRQHHQNGGDPATP